METTTNVDWAAIDAPEVLADAVEAGRLTRTELRRLGTEAARVARRRLRMITWEEFLALPELATCGPNLGGFANQGYASELYANHETRRKTLREAFELGADVATLEILRDAVRLSRHPTIVLPAHRYENLSRGRGWCRKGRGSDAQWGERVDGGYEVGPGRWIVGATDGFNRKDQTPWAVKHVRVGEQIWTVAS